MAFGFTKQRVSPIAIDFGAGCIKLLQVAPTDPPQLVAAAAAVIPDEARRDGNARAAFLDDALRRLFRTTPFKGRRVVLSFPAFQTLMQHLEVPRVDGEEADAQLNLALRTRLHIDPNRMMIRQFPVRPLVRDGVKLDEVICLAASRDVVTGYLDLAQSCKLDVAGMHAEPLALLKAFEHCCSEPAATERARCFIDIGAATTKVVIAHGTRMVFAKSIHAAGDQMTSASRARSRVLQAHEGHDAPLPGSGHGATATLDAPLPHPMASETVDMIVEELRLSLRYHASNFPDNPVQKLVFVGGEARNLGLCQTIARQVGIAAQLGDPLARLVRINAPRHCEGVDLDAVQPGWSVAMGLCLSEAAC